MEEKQGAVRLVEYVETLAIGPAASCMAAFVLRIAANTVTQRAIALSL